MAPTTKLKSGASTRRNKKQSINISPISLSGCSLNQLLLLVFMLSMAIVILPFYTNDTIAVDLLMIKTMKFGRQVEKPPSNSSGFNSLTDLELVEIIKTQNQTISSLKNAIIRYHGEHDLFHNIDEKGDQDQNKVDSSTSISQEQQSKKIEQFSHPTKHQKNNLHKPVRQRIRNEHFSIKENGNHQKVEEIQNPDGKVPIVYHGINLVPPIHGLHADQDVTLLSMKGAIEKAHNDQSAEVTIIAIEAEKDLDYPLPETNLTKGFLRRKSLMRTVLDSPHLSLYLTDSSTPRRPLPLLTDILGVLFDNSEGADYLVFTNADIGLQPDFYSHALKLVRKRDAVAINRVEIPEEVNGVTLGIDTMATILKLGRDTAQNHHGFDCFVWRRELTPIIRLAVGMIAVGYPPIGNVFVDALKCASPKFEIIKGARHTFHIGVKNGGWGLHRDQYEGYNRLCRKLGEALIIRGAKLVDSFGKCVQSENAEHDIKKQIKCGMHTALMDKQYCDLATGERAINGDTSPIKRGATGKVGSACFKLREELSHSNGAALAIDELRNRTFLPKK